MRQPRLEDGTLMRFHDGELDAEDARRVALGRLVDPNVNVRLDALAALGSAVRAWAARAGVDAAAERRRRARAQRRRRALAACGALTLAAALVLAPRAKVVGVDTVDASEQAASDMHGALGSVRGPVAVEAVDFGVHPGTTFGVPS